MTVTAPSRRRVLAGGAAVLGTAATSQLVGTSSAQAATTVRAYTGTRKPAALALHYVDRLGCGYSTATYAQLLADGGRAAWFNKQLNPSTVAESPAALALAAWFPTLADSPAVRYSKVKAKSKSVWDYARDLANYSALRRVYSNRQVLENVVDFWSNHMNVNSMNQPAWVARWGYDVTIREHALGRFEDLLINASLHPAMLLYLNNCDSKAGAPNENQGRELLELHTVGIGSGYTEQMVKDSAKILSGWTVAQGTTWNTVYDPSRHTTGAVKVLGFSSANASTDGQQLSIDYLKYLANHPATAQSIARKLCRRFVAENPSASVVSTVAQAYLAHDIKATLRALVAHPDFASSAGTLYRDPVEDWVATCRVLGVKAIAPTTGQSFANKAWASIKSIPVYQWPRPDGMPPGSSAWISAGRMLNSFKMHWQLTAGWWLTEGAVYRKAASWLPQSTISLDLWIDHLCRSVLGKGATPLRLDAVVAATGFPLTTQVTSAHRLCGSLFPRVMGTLLDTPDHMCR